MNNAIKELKDYINNNENVFIDFKIDDSNNSIILNFDNELFLQCNNIIKFSKVDIIKNYFYESSLYYSIHAYIYSIYIAKNKKYNNSINIEIKNCISELLIKVYDTANNFTIFSYKVYLYALLIDFDDMKNNKDFDKINTSEYIEILSDDNYTSKVSYDLETDIITLNLNFFNKLDDILNNNESITIENIKNSYV